MDIVDLVQQKSIDLSRNDLEDDDLDVLTKVLRESKVLEELMLCGNHITLADGKFTDALAENRTLRTLRLGYNQIGNEGAKRLGDALKRNNTLQVIWLDSNHIHDEGTKSLAAAFKVNRKLHVIDLSCNKIGDVGAESFAASLLANASLKEVSLSGNGITDKGGNSLANVLRYNCNIRRLLLRGNRISEGDMDGIKRLLDPGGVVMRMMNGVLRSFMNEKNEEITRLKKEIAIKDEELASKDKEIASLKDIIDLSGGKNDSSTKRPREEESNLATIQRKNQKIVRIKQEKEATEADLEDVREDLDIEKETVEHQLRATDVWQSRFDELAALAADAGVDAAAIAELRSRSLAGGS